MTAVEFRGDLWHQKTRVPVLSCGVVCVILRLTVLVELRLVTDGRTDTDTGPRLFNAMLNNVHVSLCAESEMIVFEVTPTKGSPYSITERMGLWS